MWHRSGKEEYRFLLTAGADADTGVDPGAGAGGEPPAGGEADGGADRGGGSPPPAERTERTPAAPAEKRSVKDELRENFKAAREADEKAAKDRRDKSGRFAPDGPRRAEGEAPEGEVPAPAGDAAPAEGAEAPAEPAADASTAAPAGLAKEAVAEWAKVPPVVQAAVNKRLADSARGVEELKTRYADLDGALAPHIEAIRKHGHTPAQATAQLFGWFQALAANPKVAFPALVKSFGMKEEDIFGRPAAPAAAVAEPASEEPDLTVLPAAVQEHFEKLNRQIADLTGKFSKVDSLESNFAAQSQQKTQEILMGWAKDKPHFEKLRGLMGQLINSGAVPLKDGNVDLDGAYEAAKWANSEVRALIQAEQTAAAEAENKKKEAARKKLLQDQADKARKTAVSVTGSAPGAPAPAAGAAKVKGKSVRESLEEARRQVAERTA